MKVFFYTLFFIYTGHAFAETIERPILQINPDSVKSVEEHFPQAVQTTKVVDTERRDYNKKNGPNLKEIKTVNYEKIVPALIKQVQEQQKEIDQLKRRQN